MERKSRQIILSLLFGLLLVCLTGCGNRAPTEKQLKDMISQEILQCTFQYETFEGQIDKLNVIRQRTEESDDYADCEVILKYPFGKRTVYISLHSLYWDKGAWMLEDWDIYEQEKLEIEDTIDEEVLFEGIESKGYVTDGEQGSITLIDADDEKTQGIRWYDITYTAANLDAWGTICVDYLLSSSESYPKEYWWNISVDSSEVRHQWHICGEWQGPIYYGSQYRGELFLTIDNLIEDYYTDIQRTYYWVKGYIDYLDSVKEYRDDRAKSESLDGRWDISLLEEGDCPNNWCIATDTHATGDVPIKYFPNEAQCATLVGGMYGNEAGDTWSTFECTQRY